jgi:hypothetical protein
VRVAKKYRRNDGISQVVDHIAAEFARHEFGQRFFLCGRLCGPKRFREDSKLRREPDQSCGEQCTWRERSRVQSAVPKDVAFHGGIPGDELCLQLQFFHHLPHWRGETRALRPKFEQIATFAQGGDNSARTRSGFQNQALNTELLKPIGTSQPGDTGANDYDFLCVSHGKQNLS